MLGAEGLTAERLCRLAERCARDGAALDAASEAAFATALRRHREGVLLSGTSLRNLPDALVLRVVGLGLERVKPGGAERLERLERLVFDTVLPACARAHPHAGRCGRCSSR